MGNALPSILINRVVRISKTLSTKNKRPKFFFSQKKQDKFLKRSPWKTNPLASQSPPYDTSLFVFFFFKFSFNIALSKTTHFLVSLIFFCIYITYLSWDLILSPKHSFSTSFSLSLSPPLRESQKKKRYGLFITIDLVSTILYVGFHSFAFYVSYGMGLINITCVI